MDRGLAVRCEKLGDVGGCEVRDAGMDRDARVEEGDVAARGLGLGKSVMGVGLVEEGLALEVGGFDEVAVDEGERADTGSGEQRGGGRAHGPTADDGDVRDGEALLAERADTGKENLAGVAVLVRDGAGRGRVVLGRDLGGHSCVLV